MGILTLGIDIGGTNFRIGTVDENGNIENFEKNSSRVFLRGDAEYMLLTEIEGYIGRYSLQNKISAAAIGLPSIISKDKTTVISTPNLKGFDNKKLSSQISKQLGFPVFVDRDVNFLLQNDIKKLKLDTDKVITGFYIGTGFGNSIYMNGEFYSGKNGAAGELGHIPLLGYTEKCTCGNTGCAEVVCSGRYLEKLSKRAFPDTPVREVFKVHGKDSRVIDFVRSLAVPIATEINILDPDYSVIAGGVVDMAEFPKNILLDAVFEMLRKPYPAENSDIRFQSHEQQSGVFGSGIFAHSKLKNKKGRLL